MLSSVELLSCSLTLSCCPKKKKKQKKCGSGLGGKKIRIFASLVLGGSLTPTVQLVPWKF